MGRETWGSGRETHTADATAYIALVALMALMPRATPLYCLRGVSLQWLCSVVGARVNFVYDVGSSNLLLATLCNLYNLPYVYFVKSIYYRRSS